ncbi:sulfotransferase family 2 domain-containing protein [Oceaniglobus trochenteri]|uniref:sulfotransferase family 2 domain-containing protein n=1 Tax=Oceaniglobus trochenteri TaxID=2763260 RepID=UPI001CFF9B0E|nr:sulfotransferase family 2 domain-containing protein [Oceaniglobus trochenteri]
MSYTPAFSADEPRVKTHQYLLPDAGGRRILYTYIRKNGCSAFKNYILANAGLKSLSDPGISKYRVKRTPGEADAPDLSIFVYRDPLKRLVSAYVNKFVVQAGAKDVFAVYTKHTGRDPQEASFLDVLTYLELGIEKMDPHFWPQKAHLLTIPYTHPIPLEDMSAEMSRILGQQNTIDMFQQKANSTQYGSAETSALADLPARELRRLRDEGRFFSPENFVTDETRPRVDALYRQDYDLIDRLTRSA